MHVTADELEALLDEPKVRELAAQAGLDLAVSETRKQLLERVLRRVALHRAEHIGELSPTEAAHPPSEPEPSDASPLVAHAAKAVSAYRMAATFR